MAKKKTLFAERFRFFYLERDETLIWTLKGTASHIINKASATLFWIFVQISPTDSPFLTETSKLISILPSFLKKTFTGLVILKTEALRPLKTEAPETWLVAVSTIVVKARWEIPMVP